MIRLGAVRWTVTSLLLLALAGCSRTDTYLDPIDAKTPLAFSMWRAHANDALTPEEWRWFDRVVQEHKYEIMRQDKASGSEAVDEAARRILDGRPLSEVMREGLQMLLRRKAAELDEMSTAAKANEQRKRLIRAGDTPMLHDFALHQAELRQRITRHEEDIAQLRAAFAAFEAKVGR